MFGRVEGPPDERRERNPLLVFLLNGLFFALLLYATDLDFRRWSHYRFQRAGAWTAWGTEAGWRRLRRWWVRTSPWYQELREQERE